MKIVISDIPGYFPPEYPEQLYLDARSISSVKDYFFVETAEVFQIKNDPSYRKRKIQTVFYDKYTIEFMTTESVDIGLLALAGTVTIIQDGGEPHLAELIDFQEPTKGQDSEFRIYNITYRDLNSKTTVNHLTFDVDDNPSFSTELYLNKEGEGFNIFFSKLFAEFSITEYNRTTDDSNQTELVSSEVAFKSITFHSYMSELDKNEILNYVNGLAAVGNKTEGVPYVYIKYNDTDYEPLETPIVTSEKGELEGLFYVTVTINYEQILNYPYV